MSRSSSQLPLSLCLLIATRWFPQQLSFASVQSIASSVPPHMYMPPLTLITYSETTATCQSHHL